MSDLSERYSFADFRRSTRKRINAAVLAVGAAAHFVDTFASDYVLCRTTQYTWGQARLARALNFNLTLARSGDEVRNGLLSRLKSIPFKNSWALHERFAKHFPPHSEER